MIKRISREARKDGSTADIKASIDAAIDHYSPERFWFNEEETTTSIGTGAVSFAYPATFTNIDSLEISSTSTDRIELLSRSIKEVRRNNRTPTTLGVPEKYATYRENIFITPSPERVYEVNILGQVELTGVSASASDNATNAWMVEGERMIREKAKSFMWASIWRNQSQAAIAEARAERAKRKLKGETDDKISSGRVERSRF